VEFAVSAEEVATPFESVVSVSVAVPPEKVPLAPDAGAVNVTATPAVGVPSVVTVATNGAANAVATSAVCPEPLVAEIETVGGGVELELLLHATRAEIIPRLSKSKSDLRNVIAHRL
jgi:hypothetical protein